MKTEFRASFLKDLKRSSSGTHFVRVQQIIGHIEKSSDLSQIPNLKKLKGYKNFYRIRVGEYRIGIMIESETVTFVRFLNRKDIYRSFP